MNTTTARRPGRGPRTPDGDPSDPRDTPSSSGSSESGEPVIRRPIGPKTPPLPPEEQQYGYYGEYPYGQQYPYAAYPPGYHHQTDFLPPPPRPPPPNTSSYYPPYYPTAPPPAAVTTAPAYYGQYIPAPPIIQRSTLTPPPQPPRLDTAVPPPPPKPAEMMNPIKTKVWAAKEHPESPIPTLPPVSTLSYPPAPPPPAKVSPVPPPKATMVVRPPRVPSVDSEDERAFSLQRTPTGRASLIAPSDILSDAHQTTVNNRQHKKKSEKNTSPKIFEALPPPPLPPAALRDVSPPKNQNASFTDVLTPKTPKTPAVALSQRIGSVEPPRAEPVKMEEIKEVKAREKSIPREPVAQEKEEEAPGGVKTEIRALPFEFFTSSQPVVPPKPPLKPAVVAPKPPAEPPVGPKEPVSVALPEAQKAATPKPVVKMVPPRPHKPIIEMKNTPKSSPAPAQAPAPGGGLKSRMEFFKQQKAQQMKNGGVPKPMEIVAKVPEVPAKENDNRVKETERKLKEPKEHKEPKPRERLDSERRHKDGSHKEKRHKERAEEPRKKKDAEPGPGPSRRVEEPMAEEKKPEATVAKEPEMTVEKKPEVAPEPEPKPVEEPEPAAPEAVEEVVIEHIEPVVEAPIVKPEAPPAPREPSPEPEPSKPTPQSSPMEEPTPVASPAAEPTSSTFEEAASPVEAQPEAQKPKPEELATEEESTSSSSSIDDTIAAVATNRCSPPVVPPSKKKREPSSYSKPPAQSREPSVSRSSYSKLQEDRRIREPSVSRSYSKPLPVTSTEPAVKRAPSVAAQSSEEGPEALSAAPKKPVVVTKAALKQVLPPPAPSAPKPPGPRGKRRRDESLSRSPTPPILEEKRRMKSPLTPRNNQNEMTAREAARERALAMVTRPKLQNLNSEKECRQENTTGASAGLAMFLDPNFKPKKISRNMMMGSRAGSITKDSVPSDIERIRFDMDKLKKEREQAEDEMIRDCEDPLGNDGKLTLAGFMYPEGEKRARGAERNVEKKLDFEQRQNVLRDAVLRQGSKITGVALSAAKRVQQEESELKANQGYKAINPEFARSKRRAETMLTPSQKLSLKTLKRLTKEHDLPRISHRFRHFVRVKAHINGGGYMLSCDYLEFKDKMKKADINIFCRQFLRLGMAETNEEAPVFCIAIMENGAIDTNNAFKMLIDTDPQLKIKAGNLTSKQELQTMGVTEYYEQVMDKYKHGIFRYGPMHAVTLTGKKVGSEEVGKCYTKLLGHFDAHPLLHPVMPWGEFTDMYETDWNLSNDGPILWVRPGEQMVSSTDIKEEEITMLSVTKRNKFRETEFQDRTLCHADIAGDDDTHSAKRTGAIGVLQCIPGTEAEILSAQCPEERPAVKEVVAFAGENMDAVFNLLSMDFYSFPTRQCTQYVDEAKLNAMRTLGIRYAKFHLRANDMYFLPRNIVHQFRTIQACVSMAWHTRLVHQFKLKKMRWVPDEEFECRSDYSDNEEEQPVEKKFRI